MTLRLEDFGGRALAPGDAVTYHGSLTAAHGTWTFGGYCCAKCMPVGEELAEARFVLYRFADSQKLEHVSRSSFGRTAEEAPAR